MKILFSLNHPAHYFLFKYIIKVLKDRKHEIKIVIKDKDILEKILKAENVKYNKLFRMNPRKKTFLSIFSNLFLEMLKQDFFLYKFCKDFKPDLLVGTDISISHVGKFLQIKSVVFNEDDFEINKGFCYVTYPFVSHIVSPNYTSVGGYDFKKIGYNGIQKMAYLHSNYFKPDLGIREVIGLRPKDRYYIVRLVNLTAGHDIESDIRGINDKLLNQIILRLEKFGKVFISSERKLSSFFKKYLTNIPVNKMHDFISSADMFIGDSQTMCAEAGLLGTPFIRINNFIGKIEYLNDLENNYKLGKGFSPNEVNKILSHIDYILKNKNIKREFIVRSKKVFEDKTDVVRFAINTLEKVGSENL